MNQAVLPGLGTTMLQPETHNYKNLTLKIFDLNDFNGIASTFEWLDW